MNLIQRAGAIGFFVGALAGSAVTFGVIELLKIL
jgi:hypothetical protein